MSEKRKIKRDIGSKKVLKNYRVKLVYFKFGYNCRHHTVAKILYELMANKFRFLLDMSVHYV
jgi:hypothetical protein